MRGGGVPSYMAGSGSVYFQSRNGLLICREYDFPDILNLTTGTVTQLPGLEELLREIEPDFKGKDIRDECYGYKDLCIVKTGCERENTWVNHNSLEPGG